jgi:N-acetyl-gamma-glutamyl-phosphate reductase
MSIPLVFIDGDQGTTGLQIHDRLRNRTDLKVITLPAEERKDLRRRGEAINACDIAILCLPDAAAREAVSAIVNPRVRVIDASSAHRIDPDWTYGFPELVAGQSDRIAVSNRVSNPGCYATGAISLLRPLQDGGLIPSDYPISVFAVSGYSGSGRTGVEEYEGPNAANAPPYQVYGLGLRHKHVPEMQHHAGLAQRPLFVPSIGAFRQGIVLTVPLEVRLLPTGVDPVRLRDCLTSHYAGAKHIRVQSLLESESVGRVDPRSLNGTDDLQLSVFNNQELGQVLLTAVFDNLGKGAGGAAVQNLDLMLTRLLG